MSLSLQLGLGVSEAICYDQLARGDIDRWPLANATAVILQKRKSTDCCAVCGSESGIQSVNLNDFLIYSKRRLELF